MIRWSSLATARSWHVCWANGGLGAPSALFGGSPGPARAPVVHSLIGYPQHCPQGCSQNIRRNSQGFPLPSHRTPVLHWETVPLAVRYAAEQNVRRSSVPSGVLGAGHRIRDPEPAISHRRAAGSSPGRVRYRPGLAPRAPFARCWNPWRATISTTILDGAELQCCNFKSGIYHYRLWSKVGTGDIRNNI